MSAVILEKYIRICFNERYIPSPPVIGVIPVRQLIVVVLPAPLGPRRQNSWSFSRFTHKPLTEWNGLVVEHLQQPMLKVPGYVFRRPCI
jgi:hypothetical protein